MKSAVFTLIFIGLLSGMDVSGQALPGKKDQYDFLQWYINKNPLVALSDSLQQLENASFKITALESSARPERKFTKKDITYIKRQLQDKYNPTTLDTALLHGADWKAPGTPAIPVTYLSLPVFSNNKHIVLINRKYICGPQCTEGGVEIYIRDKDGNWVW